MRISLAFCFGASYIRDFTVPILNADCIIGILMYSWRGVGLWGCVGSGWGVGCRGVGGGWWWWWWWWWEVGRGVAFKPKRKQTHWDTITLKHALRRPLELPETGDFLKNPPEWILQPKKWKSRPIFVGTYVLTSDHHNMRIPPPHPHPPDGLECHVRMKQTLENIFTNLSLTTFDTNQIQHS